MNVFVKPKYLPQAELNLEEINKKLESGEFDGSEQARISEANEWTTLDKIEGVIIPTHSDTVNDSQNYTAANTTTDHSNDPKTSALESVAIKLLEDQGKGNQTVDQMNGIILPQERTWIVILAVTCMLVLAYGYFYSKNIYADPAFLVGYYLPSSILIWIAYFIVGLRKLNARKIGVTFLAIYVSMMASGLIGYSQNRMQAKTAIDEIRNEWEGISESTTSTGGMPGRINTKVETKPKSRGEYGEIERYAKEVMDQMVSQRNSYVNEVSGIGWNSILDARRIEKDVSLVESKTLIRKARALVKKYSEKTQVLLNDAKDNIHSLNVSESVKKSMIIGFEEGMDIAAADIEETWELENQAVNEFAGIIDLLAATTDDWIVQGGQILFLSEANLSKFNNHIVVIQEIVQKQVSIQSKSSSEVDRRLGLKK